MAFGRRIVRVSLVLLTLVGLAVWVIALLMFSQTVEDSDDFARNMTPTLIINAIGVSVMLALIGHRLFRLIRDYRRFVPGSRLEARLVSLIVLIATVPLAIFYMFSVLLIEMGIDEWFKVDISNGPDNILELERAALDLTEENSIDKLRGVADQLVVTPPGDRNRALAGLWSGVGAHEVVIFTSDGRRLTSYSSPAAEPGPVGDLDPTIVDRLRDQSAEFLDTDFFGGRQQIQAALPLPRPDGGYEVLYARFPLPANIEALINSVDLSRADFDRLGVVRTGLELVFTLVLSVVVLASILAAVYAAFFAAQRLTSPIQRLMQGTRAVARGDYDTKVPQARGDEIGFLVNSFNDMTQRLALARKEASDSEQRLEEERSKLEVILEHLSTGVVSLETDMTIRTANKAAGEILGVDLEAHIGESLVDLAAERPLLKEFLDISARHFGDEESEWRDQITLHAVHGNRELVCACTNLPTEGEHGEGYIVVFDDITALMRAQREAAWGEVARRLAHEIKNPLTPIQLSAERVRRRYLSEGNQDLDLLDRATHTIIQQVDAMKGMVDAFSEYARAPDIELKPIDLNALIGEVTELYRHQVSPVSIRLELEQELPELEADIGRLRQVMHNLMRNASEAVEGKRDATIEVATRRRDLSGGSFVEIVVADNGPGFAADIIDQAFLPYVTSKARGTGLGLAIVRKLVEEHGGRIHASNKAQGGAEVSILLPLSDAGRSVGLGRRAQHRRKRA